MDSPSAAAGDSYADDLEPLFNYERVLPSDLLAFDDDAYDCSPVSPECKRRRASVALCMEPKAKGAMAAVVFHVDDDGAGFNAKEVPKAENDDEDWLTLPPPPPRKLPSSRLQLEEDQILKQLRYQYIRSISKSETAARL